MHATIEHVLFVIAGGIQSCEQRFQLKLGPSFPEHYFRRISDHTKTQKAESVKEPIGGLECYSCVSSTKGVVLRIQPGLR